MGWQKILKYISSIKKPISLAALIVLVLYGIYKLILSLPIFESLGGYNTFILLDKIALYLFITALVTIFLSISSSIIKEIMKQKSKSIGVHSPSQEKSNIKKTRTAIKKVGKDVMRPEEYIFLLDEIVTEVKDMEYLGNTFGTMRRKLALISKLQQKAAGYLPKFVSKTNNINNSILLNFVNELLPGLISEADYVLPYPAEEKYVRDRERLKELKYKVRTVWENIKKEFFEDPIIKSKFLEFKANDNLNWPTIGFKNIEDYYEYMTPSFKTLSKKATPIQSKLLSVILSGNITKEELITLGFPKEVIVETVNMLIVSQLITTDDYKNFSVTPVGKEIIYEYLNKIKNVPA